MAVYRSLSRTHLLLLAATLVALALRVWNLGGHALLPDEGSSYYFAHLPLATLWWSLCDPHPPGYYLLLRGVAALGQEEAWLRLPSALAGTLAIPLTWAAARAALRPTTQPAERWPDQAALLAAALVAVAPLAVWYSRELRAYALLSLLTLCAAWAGLRWRRRPSTAAALSFLLCGWLALWTEYGALAILIGLNLFVLSGWPWRPQAGSRASADRRWLALQVALFAPFVAWWLASAQRSALAQMSYQAIFLAVQAQRLGLDWTPTSASRVIVVTGLAAAGLALATALAVRRSPRVRGWLGSPWVAAVLLGLVLALALWGALPRLYTVKRHLNALLPFLSIVAAWALLRTPLPVRVTRTIAVSSVLLSLGLSLLMLWRAPQPPWPQVVAVLRAQLASTDALWVDELDAPVFDYYWRDEASWQPLRARDLTALDQTPQEQRVWLLGSVSPYRDLRQTLPPQFASRHTAVRSFDWPEVTLTAYQPSAIHETMADPPLALRWGLGIQSPLDVVCR